MEIKDSPDDWDKHGLLSRCCRAHGDMVPVHNVTDSVHNITDVDTRSQRAVLSSL